MQDSSAIYLEAQIADCRAEILPSWDKFLGALAEELNEPMYGPGPDGKFVPLEPDPAFARICAALREPELAAAYERARRCEVKEQAIMDEFERGIRRAIVTVGELSSVANDQLACRLVYFEHNDRSLAGLYGYGAEEAPYLGEPEYLNFGGPEYFRVGEVFSCAAIRQPLWDLVDAVDAMQPQIDTEWSVVDLLYNSEFFIPLQRLYALRGYLLLHRTLVRIGPGAFRLLGVLPPFGCYAGEHDEPSECVAYFD